MGDPSFLTNCIGVHYPYQFTTQPAQNTVKNLVEYACNFLVKDASILSRHLAYISQDLFPDLMRAALHGQHDLTVSVLVAHWPYPVLNLLTLLPSSKTLPVHVMYDNPLLERYMRTLVKYTAMLTMSFVSCVFESLRKRLPMKLRLLDVAGFPMDEYICRFLASRSMASRSKLSVSLEERLDEKIKTDFTYVVKFDLFLKIADLEAAEAFDHRVASSTYLQLDVRRIEINEVGYKFLVEFFLYHMSQHRNQESLRLQMNSITADEFYKLEGFFLDMRNLTSLDLCGNCLSVTGNSRIQQSISRVLKTLTHLVRLDLTDVRLSETLSSVLSNIQRPLQWLTLCGCRLRQSDLAYLGRSRHVEALVMLDLSSNSLFHCFNELTDVVLNCRATLQVLELESCQLLCPQLKSLSITLTTSVSLLYVNLAQNRFLFEIESMNNIARIPHVQAIRFSYPNEFAYDAFGEVCDSAIERYNEYISTLISLRGLIVRAAITQFVMII